MKFGKVILVVVMGILLFGNILALSEEALKAKDSLANAEQNIKEMQQRGIPVNRVNETYQDALQIYNAQVLFEERGQGADYKLVFQYVDDLQKVKDTAIEAKDELSVFIETYDEAKLDTNLSSFEEEYNNILLSFEEERFEDTLNLVNDGYEELNEIQSSQTATKVFYLTTTQTIKDFFVNYWLHLLVGIISLVLIILIFWNRFIKWRLKKKLKHIEIQKGAVNGLIRKMQKNYFKTKNLSESEYLIKLKKYGELLRDIERQKMVIKGRLYQQEREDKIRKNPSSKTNQPKEITSKNKKQSKKNIIKNISQKKVAKKKVVKKKKNKKR